MLRHNLQCPTRHGTVLAINHGDIGALTSGKYIQILLQGRKVRVCLRRGIDLEGDLFTMVRNPDWHYVNAVDEDSEIFVSTDRRDHRVSYAAIVPWPIEIRP